MSRGWRAAALLAAFVLLAGCTMTGTSNAQNHTPTITAVPVTSPSSSPSSSPTASQTPTSSPTTSPSPSGSAPTITSLPFHNGEVGVSYASFQLGAAGGTPPYQWSIASGAFSSGITLTSDGTVSGTPGSAGHFGFAIRVTDSAGGSATTPASFGIASALAVTQPCAGTCAVEQGCTICGRFGTVGGGVGPYNYQITVDNRPTGMGVSGLSLTNAFPSPDPVANFDMTVLVSDQYGAQKFVSAKWYVYLHIAISGGGGCITSFYVFGCTASGWTYSGGTPGASPTVMVVKISQYCSPNGTCYPVPSSPPTGFTATASNGSISISVPQNSQTSTYGAVLTLVLIDQSPCAPNAHCTSTGVGLNIQMDAG